MSTIVERLGAALDGVTDVSLDPEILEGYRHDQAAPGLLEAGTPAILARPRSTSEVQAVVDVARRLSVPIVPRGAGSGLSGGANALDGCVVLCTERMGDVIEVDPHAGLARAQAGVLNSAIKDAAAPFGLWYPPDPASAEFSTIGGNVATNAGGLCCVKYGVTRDALLGVEAVLADGRVVRLGGLTRKNVAGYDLLSLLCGSEGTLGVITEVTVRLIREPQPPTTLAATFTATRAAAKAVGAVVRACSPSLLELMDATTIAAVEEMAPMDLDSSTAALLFAQSDIGGTTGQEEVARIASACEEAGAAVVAISEDPAEGRMLLAARRLAYPALERKGATLLDDIAVPISRIPDLLERISAVAEDHEVTIGTFGHAGEGNMHPTIVYRRGDPQDIARARRAFIAIVELAIDLGGTVTGEHGVGTLKRALLTHAHRDLASLYAGVKGVFDPDGLLNPGKVL